jgi:hypothetical protein
VANYATDEARKMKKDAKKAKKEVWVLMKLQRGKRRQGSDEEVEEEDDDDDEEEEGDDIPWDELAHDDEGSSSQPTALAQVPPDPTPTLAQEGADVRIEATRADCHTPVGAPAQVESSNGSAPEMRSWGWGVQPRSTLAWWRPGESRISLSFHIWRFSDNCAPTSLGICCSMGGRAGPLVVAPWKVLALRRAPSGPADVTLRERGGTEEAKTQTGPASWTVVVELA